MTEGRLARPPNARDSIMRYRWFVDFNNDAFLTEVLDEFEFNLFSTSTKAVKIEDTPIRPAEPTATEPVAPLVVNNKRPDSYYYRDDKYVSFHTNSKKICIYIICRDEVRLQRVSSCAVSGEDIISQSTTSWPGMQMPWRVIHLPLPTTATKSKKPSKKRRLILKKRAERRQSEPVKTRPFKNNDIRNWRFYNTQQTPKPKLARRLGNEKEKPMKPYKIAL
ncbi:hypothetical protein V1525DRAFT_428133 [Lipomyces kononenkoae]|uniref:Uncharacterized protein n=1 Tax=Lipomyces kononenkoae TaxID=34357 RepID=A0ACC3STQ1_LIPKO